MLLGLRLKKVRLKQQKKLNKTNLYLYKSITSYIQSSDLRGIEKEEILQQIIDMMLQAQIENKPIKLIIGDNYEEFCKLIIKEYSMGKNKTYNILNYIQKYLFWMILILAVMFISREERLSKAVFDFGITVDQFIVANVLALIILPASKKSRQETTWIKSLPQRLLMIISNRVFKKAVLFMIFIFTLQNLVRTKIIDPRVFNHRITLLEAVPYMILVFVLIGLIEIYKSVYDENSKVRK